MFPGFTATTGHVSVGIGCLEKLLRLSCPFFGAETWYFDVSPQTQRGTEDQEDQTPFCVSRALLGPGPE